MLKQKLLNIGFIDNEFLDLYIDLLEKDYSNFTGYSERHHAIPVLYYRLKNNLATRDEARPIAEADPENLIVYLPFAEHAKAHWYLYKCTAGQLKYCTGRAFILMVEGFKTTPVPRDLSETEYAELQAWKEKLVSDSDYRWNIEEKNWLIENYEKLGRNKCAEILGYSKVSVGTMAFRLGIAKKYCAEAWKAEEDQFLKDNYWSWSVKELAAKLGRSIPEVYKRLGKLNLTKMWDENRLAELKKLYLEGKSIAELSKLFKKSKKAIKGQIIQYGWAKLK